jgi:hypothetical protein
LVWRLAAHATTRGAGCPADSTDTFSFSHSSPKNLPHSTDKLSRWAPAASRSSAASRQTAAASDHSPPGAASRIGRASSSARRSSPNAAAVWSATSCRSPRDRRRVLFRPIICDYGALYALAAGSMPRTEPNQRSAFDLKPLVLTQCALLLAREALHLTRDTRTFGLAHQTCAF